jgi:lysophospholipase L1-like esterase
MKKLLSVFLLFILFQSGYAQKPDFWDDIEAFRKRDSIEMPAPNQVLFVGSSSFTLWTDVQTYFPSVPILNRGFGGSSLIDLLRYKEEVIFKYKPKQIVMYCGENDFAANDTVSVQTVVGRFKQLFGVTRQRLGNISFVYVSMKPSPSRKHLMPKFAKANAEIRSFLKKYRNTAFVDVYQSMLKPDGSPMTDIFLEDNLHMNAKGYAIWQKLLAPYLLN